MDVERSRLKVAALASLEGLSGISCVSGKMRVLSQVGRLVASCRVHFGECGVARHVRRSIAASKLSVVEWGRLAQAACGALPNNGMHPTGQSVDVIRQLECLCQCFPAGDAGR